MQGWQGQVVKAKARLLAEIVARQGKVKQAGYKATGLASKQASKASCYAGLLAAWLVAVAAGLAGLLAGLEQWAKAEGYDEG